jgi:hypothetical protein
MITLKRYSHLLDARVTEAAGRFDPAAHVDTSRSGLGSRHGARAYQSPATGIRSCNATAVQYAGARSNRASSEIGATPVWRWRRVKPQHEWVCAASEVHREVLRRKTRPRHSIRTELDYLRQTK